MDVETLDDRWERRLVSCVSFRATRLTWIEPTNERTCWSRHVAN